MGHGRDQEAHRLDDDRTLLQALPDDPLMADTEGMFCFEDDHIGCVCGWCHMTEKEMRESLGEDPTITPEALNYFQGLAEDAEADIAKLPEGSQPFWFREVRG